MGHSQSVWYSICVSVHGVPGIEDVFVGVVAETQTLWGVHPWSPYPNPVKMLLSRTPMMTAVSTVASVN